MDKDLFERVYMSMTGELITPMPGVEDAFAEGTECSKLYEEVYCASIRIRERLSTEDDEDIDIILDSLFAIQRELCRRMYIYGATIGAASEMIAVENQAHEK